MKKALAGLLTFLLLFLLNNCSASNVNQKFPYGNYQYRSYNFLGDLVGEGTLYVDQSGSNEFTGNWNIRMVRDCRNCGAQFGSGFLTGHIENDTMYINLNPDDTEIDTYLVGLLNDGEYNGDWRWVSEEGFGYYGTFEAIKL